MRIHRTPAAVRSLSILLVMVAAAGVFTVGGCTVGPDYEQPELPTVPDAWNTAATEGLADGSAPLQTWWAVFDDPTLNSLIERAGASNLSLREALWRVEEARALRGVVAGARVPGVDLSAEAGRSEPSDNSALGELAPDGLEAGNIFDLGVGASWEIDLWGRVRRQVEAADAEVEVSVEEWRDILVSLYAEVASNYVVVRTSQERLRLAHDNVAGQENTLKLTEDRFNAGLVSALDVAQAESNLANTRSLIPTLEQNLELARNRLAVLLAMNPGALDEELSSENPIPTEPTAITAGLPADLLRQRPDIRTAERRLAAQTARIGVATAELYPQFSLGGFLGLQSTSAGDLFSSESVNWSIGLPIRWKLFAGGSVRSQIAAEEARTEALLANYERVVLVALEEVEDAMVSYEKEVARRAHLEMAVDATQRSLDLVLTQYRSGLADFQNVLDTERSLLLRQDDLATSEGIVIRNLVDLYRALGGGWDPETAEEPVKPPSSFDVQTQEEQAE
ncbi:MAG: efflux transporter outer membrane subunit [Thermoanaerobaculales bacterium]|jgi:NodT family efflux transporter outer membrane factor (OMF) lipoprotein|nr:efflux transporter outer membrane subunit [Thermoanaerobaculales bacterium]